MRNDLKGAERQRVALQKPPRAHRQCAAVFRADAAGPDHVEVPRKRLVPAPDVAQDGGLKLPPSPPPRRPCPPTWCRRKAPGVSAFLKSKITATATMKTRTFIGPDFFPTDKKRSRTHVHRGLPSGRAGAQGGCGGAAGARQLPGRRGQEGGRVLCEQHQPGRASSTT